MPNAYVAMGNTQFTIPEYLWNSASGCAI